MKKTYYVTLEYVVDVEVDETKFTDQFMEEYSISITKRTTIDEHMQNLAIMYARGLIDYYPFPDAFIEGYGKMSEMGIKLDLEFRDTEVREI